MTDVRKDRLQAWFEQQSRSLFSGESPQPNLSPVSGDASFRRYFRGRVGEQAYILVDAPPDNEDNPSFVKVSELFKQAGVNVPDIYAVDYEDGFMLLEDFGDALYLPELESSKRAAGKALPKNAESLYRAAIASLLKLQSGVDAAQLPPYDEAQLRREMALFPEWFCGRFLGLELSADEEALLETTFAFLVDQALQQPVVAVHRDFHSRNLMLLPTAVEDRLSPPGVIDFQDAVGGPYTYDAVSLFRDCYVEWPEEWVRRWALQYFHQARTSLALDIDEARFVRDFDLIGLQRHLKVIGIFSRLAIRDNKPGYLADIPLVVSYLLSVARSYNELADFVAWFDHRVAPEAATKLKTG